MWVFYVCLLNKTLRVFRYLSRCCNPGVSV